MICPGYRGFTLAQSLSSAPVLGSPLPLEESMPVCAICEHLSLPPRPATGTVGLFTDSVSMDESAIDHLGSEGSERHLIVHACPEHVVDVYRGRISGMRMAWKLATEPAVVRPQSPATASASRA